MRRPRNVFLQFSSESDFVKAMSRESCEVNGVLYRPFHWTPNFKEDEEPSCIPVWTFLPSLPPNFYHESFLKILTAPIGRFIHRHNPTCCATQVDGAILCVEMDAAKEHLSYFWIGAPGMASSLKQEIMYETLPAFCCKCRMQGHNSNNCRYGKNQGIGDKVWVQKIGNWWKKMLMRCRK